MDTKQAYSMIDTDKALSVVLSQTEEFGIEEINLDQSFGRVLKETIHADRDFPPFDRVSMDGIAFAYSSFEKGQRSFKVSGTQAAGAPQLTLEDPQECLEVMTGAMLPEGCDVVVPYEQINIEEEIAHLEIDLLKERQNIHDRGRDRKSGDILLDKNRKIGAAEIGILATVGKSRVQVARLPKIAIISTGDELVNVSEHPAPYQIRKSNVHTLSALCQRESIMADLYHITDDKQLLRNQVEQLLKSYHVLMFSGAVSKGKFDYLPEILDELDVNKLFHKVKQRPGKPFWFGKKDRTTVFAFPGNPVSTFVSCLKYFVPWLRSSLEIPYKTTEKAILKANFSFKPELTYFLQVKLSNENGQVLASPIVGNGSGDLANLSLNDAFMELPASFEHFTEGESFPLLIYR